MNSKYFLLSYILLIIFFLFLISSILLYIDKLLNFLFFAFSFFYKVLDKHFAKYHQYYLNLMPEELKIDKILHNFLDKKLQTLT